MTIADWIVAVSVGDPVTIERRDDDGVAVYAIEGRAMGAWVDVERIDVSSASEGPAAQFLPGRCRYYVKLAPWGIDLELTPADVLSIHP